ncbi:HAD-IA family hydrolase [Streptomyces sp. CdTB01]|uniref:HAD family hydrolase n=1 Tax=Streptomyces sp. CdTB01 TaxID=1725411 RepID=UPI00099E7BE6|nr:HAD-IA family hydrolase [Streptomyces sp. CdTB01]
MVRRPLGNHHDGPDTLLVTSDTAQTERMAAQVARLRELTRQARVVLWDFDGPICRLFAGHSAQRVASDLVHWLETQGLRGVLTDDERSTADPHVVLRVVDRRHPASELVAELEERLTKEELRAVPSALPTAFADPLIRTWKAVGARLAVATNNSPEVARAYLSSRGLLDAFLPHIYGRTHDLQYLKPHPHYLNRALTAMGAAPTSALFIGDTPTDCEAARQAGVPFLGYARNEHKERLLQEAGATDIVRSLRPLLETLWG